MSQGQRPWWGQREYTPRERLLALVPLGAIFTWLLPLALIRAAAALDRRWHLPRFDFGLMNRVAALVIGIGGWALAMWTIIVQFTQGRGTPAPALPTQKLLTDGPYARTRNPMALGTILLYVAPAIWRGSSAGVGLATLFAGSLAAYMKLIEEQEMEARFGDAYRAYRERTPFLIPRW
jgi:protein-S-isoprenylcysteine O-methyltransferase Ste14